MLSKKAGIDIYLQPMVTLPQRKVRFYEAVTRLRDDKDQILAADDFIAVAEAGGLIGKIDHMVMLRCIQVLRRLMVRNKDVGVFCNVSASTLATRRSSRNVSTSSKPIARWRRRSCWNSSRRRSAISGRSRPKISPRCAARLPLLDRPCHRPADRAARTGRARRPLHQGAGGAAARPEAASTVGHPRLPIFPTCSAASAST